MARKEIRGRSGQHHVGREKSLALTKLEEAVFRANASIARNGD